MSVTSTLAGYALLAALTAFFFRSQIASWVASNRPAPTPTGPPREIKPVKKPKSAKSTSRTPVPAVAEVQGTAVDASSEPPSNDHAFAREFALAQKGTDLTKKDQKKNRSKTKKQSKAVESAIPTQATDDAGFADATALDENMKNNDPSLDTANTVKSSGANGMDTDYGQRMAGSLRFLPEEELAPVPREDEWTNVPTKSQKTQRKAERAEETKKQRQRLAQKEQYRELKEEADKKQRVLMEAQLRRARIARNEPAKNGESYSESSAPTNSVWIRTANSAETAETQLELLDTSEEVPIIANGDSHSDPASL